jgi:hypothetical protein
METTAKHNSYGRQVVAMAKWFSGMPANPMVKKCLGPFRATESMGNMRKAYDAWEAFSTGNNGKT